MAKKITAIVSLSIIAFIIIATIIMANVKVDYGIKCATPNEIHISSSLDTFDPADEQTKSKIVSIINKASKESSLNALFNGGLFAHAKVNSDTDNGTTTIKTSSNSVYVNYVYSTPQVLKQGNKNYKDDNGNNYLYKELCFEVKNTDGVEEIKVYIIPDSHDFKRYSLYYTLSGDFSELYSYITSII